MNHFNGGIEVKKQKSMQDIFQTAFDQLRKKQTFKHVVIHAETMDGNFRFMEASGIINEIENHKMTLKTPFNIASVTKIFIASIIFLLIEEKKLSLKTKVSTYISHPLIKDENFNPGDVITIAHLLSHTSGIPDYLEIKDEHKKTLFDFIVKKGDQSWLRSDFFDRVLLYGKPYFEPQDLHHKKIKARYSDTNFQLLIEIIEHITRLSIDEAFETYIYQPLHLSSSFHEGTKKALSYSEKASLYANHQEMSIPKALISFGDIYSTTEDLVLMMKGLISGTLFKSKDTFQKMIGHWHTFGFQMIPTSPGWPIEYSYGITRLIYPKFLPPFKQIPEFYGHTGVTGSWLFYVPKYDLIIAGDVGQLSASAVPYQFMTKLLVELEKHEKSTSKSSRNITQNIKSNLYK